MPRKVSKYKINEISLVDVPAHESARVTLAKRADGAPSKPKEETTMADETQLVTLTKQAAEAELKAKQAEVELTKAKEEVTTLQKSVDELKAKVEAGEKPTPVVIYKMANGMEITTADDPKMQALAKQLQDADFAKQAAKDYKHVDTDVAVSLLKAGQEETLKTLEKQQAAFVKAGGTLQGQPATQDADDDGSFKQPTDEEVHQYMKRHGHSNRMDAVRAMARGQVH